MIRISIHCQRSNALKMHKQQLLMQYDTIHTPVTMQCNAMSFSTVRFDPTIQRNDAMQFNEFDYYRVNSDACEF